MTIPQLASFPFSQAPHSFSRRRTAFTLVELLVVMGIIVLLMGLAVPVATSFLRGRAVDRAINSLTGILELARAEAMERRTFVYIAFKTVTNKDNNTELRVAAIMSANGQSDWSLANLRPISKLVILPNIKLSKYSDLPKAVQASTTVDIKSDGSYMSSWWGDPPSATGFPAVVVDGESFKDTIYSGFDADGQMGLSSTQDPFMQLFQTQVCYGLVPTHGTTPDINGKDGAVVTIYGGSDKLRISRP